MKSIRLIILLACLLPIRLVAGEQATAVATVTLGFVTAITVTAGGSGYSSEPRVTLVGGGGSGAIAKAILSGDKVALIIVQSAGSGYTGAPAVSIQPGPQSLRLGVELVPKITVYGPSGTAARVEWSTSLGNGVISEWHLLKTVTVGTAEATVVDLDVGTVPRFYRAVAEPTPNELIAPTGFVRIPAGTFTMGSPTTEKWQRDYETQHMVTLTKDFYMSKYEVTQAEYLAVMGNNPSFFTTTDSTGKAITPDLNRPVEQVSWNDATNYCARLTASEKAVGRLPAGWVYRLPTEAEWEYACRAGTSTPFHYGNDLRSGMANFVGTYEYVGGTGTVNNPNGTYLARTTAVGSYAPNGFGLYDMHGNVWEWCLDWYGSYPGGNVSDPRNSATSATRVIRGGSSQDAAGSCRSAFRDSYKAGTLGPSFGFRPVLAPGQ